ncbi:MAG: histidinol phosphatase [Flavobacteriaceae bacterium]|jgi:tyrosine-protein phosphatase YwqE|nr:histidinol phosphatase [Flavobacteriaceae bacterium]
MSILSKLFSREPKGVDISQATGKLSFLEIDMHNHLLPGIDDGSGSVEQSLELIQGLQQLGLNRFICTPHILQGMYENTKESIETSRLTLTEYLTKQNNSAQLFGAAEHMIDDGLTSLLKNNNLSVMPGNYVLIEMSYLSESKALFQTISDIQKLGYRPILAHPERYNYYHYNFPVYKEIKDAGCALQLNLLSISRYYGVQVKSTALTLLKSGMYDFVGTDLHHTKHLKALQEIAIKYPIQDLLKHCNIKNAELANHFDEYISQTNSIAI